VEIEIRDAVFAPVPDAAVKASAVTEAREAQTLSVRRTDGGHFVASFAPDRPGIYQIHADASRGSTALGSVDRSVYVGGSEREFADPRLNDAFLRRLADASGGRYAGAGEASQIASWLDDAARESTSVERRDVWDRAWVFTTVVLLLCVEWTLRRRWGLR
jgi:hypothetical protein